MPTKKSEESHSHAALESEVAALRKEVAALKRELAKKSSGGADSRVDLLLKTILEFGDLKLKNGIKSTNLVK